ncbi:thiamine pyrophosphate-dependent enzyme [Cupriavidus sp. 2TAF22]|uniref:thiamine pyrophosphate-dependent enzyme n=1 Tax=unclassified Cupriavidus TaxID=2640874 RepID=UPI003F8E241E
MNNRSYRIVKERPQALRGMDHFVAMDMTDPPIDFVRVATGLGVHAKRISDPSAIEAELLAAVNSGGPSLLEIIVDDGFASKK